MDQKTTISQCGRGEDLVSFLYGEADEREASNFETHLHKCAGCQSELAGFGHVHQSMVSWRDEILSGFVSSPVAVPARKKSALLALREFFDLSPLWMKGAVGFAALLLCALAFISLSQLRSTPSTPVISQSSDARYTQKELDEHVSKAREEWNATRSKFTDDKPVETVASVPSTPSRPKVVREVRPPKSRSPLSKSERDQLAADLRLLSSENDELTLLGDRINQQF